MFVLESLVQYWFLEANLFPLIASNLWYSSLSSQYHILEAMIPSLHGHNHMTQAWYWRFHCEMSYDSTSSLCGHMTNHARAKQLPVPSTGCWIIMLVTTHVGIPVEHWIFNIKTCPDNPVHPNYCNFAPNCLSSVAGSHAFFGSIFVTLNVSLCPICCSPSYA